MAMKTKTSLASFTLTNFLIICTRAIHGVQIIDIPNGFISFSEKTCEAPYWNDVTDQYRGRIIVSTTDPNENGFSIGRPLKSKEARGHEHVSDEMCTNRTSFQSTAGGFPSSTDASPRGEVQGILGSDICIEKGAATLTQSRGDEIPYIQLRVCEYKRPVQETKDLIIPTGTVGYFSPQQVTQCPVGWKPFMSSQGRTLVLSGFLLSKLKNDNVQSMSTIPSAKNRLGIHSHRRGASFKTKFIPQDLHSSPNPFLTRHLLRVNISNNNGIYKFNGTLAEGSLDLPYVQLLTCESIVNSSISREQNQNADILPSHGVITYSNKFHCDSGWDEVNARYTGRIVVSLPTGVNETDNSATFGSSFQITSNLGNAKYFHSHPQVTGRALLDSNGGLVSNTSGVEVPIVIPSVGLCRESTCEFLWNENILLARNGTYPVNFTDELPGVHSDELPIPYMMLLACTPKLVQSNSTPTLNPMISETTLQPSSSTPTVSKPDDDDKNESALSKESNAEYFILILSSLSSALGTVLIVIGIILYCRKRELFCFTPKMTSGKLPGESPTIHLYQIPMNGPVMRSNHGHNNYHVSFPNTSAPHQSIQSMI